MNDDLSLKIKEKLGENRLFYVCRDIERAEGLCEYFNLNIYIITNQSPYSLKLKQEYPNNIILIDNGRILDTHELLVLYHFEENKEFGDIDPRKVYPDFTSKLKMTIQPNDFVMVFKNTKKIENLCQKNNWRLLNPPAELASFVEEKISQIEWLGELKKYLPGYEIKQMKEIEFTKEPFIIQFNHSHTGSGTTLIKSKEDLEKLKKEFPNRLARIARYINGPLLTNNNVVWGDKILMGNISYQITGLKPFTNREFATIGNDWSLGKNFLNDKQISEYQKIVNDIGQKLIEQKWKGLFGVDIVLEQETGKLYLLEINARQPASTSYESWLQTTNSKQQQDNNSKITTIDAHMAALLEIPYNNEELIKINNGAQIVLRKSQEPKIKNQETVIAKLQANGYKLIQYDNGKEEADWLRIQSQNGIMKEHNQFNEFGEQILNSIS